MAEAKNAATINRLMSERQSVLYILVKVPCECITGNIARGRGREPIKHEAQPSALFARDHAPSAIFPVMHERERYFNWFIVAAFLASAALNDSKWALRSNCPSRCSEGAVATRVSACDL